MHAQEHVVFADEALPDTTHSPKQSSAAAPPPSLCPSGHEGILHNRGERALVHEGEDGGGLGAEVEPLNAFDKTRPLDDVEVIRKRSCTRRTSGLHASLKLGTYRDRLKSVSAPAV